MSNILKKIFEPTIRKRMLFFVVLDVLLIELSVYLAFILRFEGQIPLEFQKSLFSFLALAPIFVISTLYFQKIYWLNWVYVGISDLIKLLKGLTLSFFLFGVLVFIFRDSLFSLEYFAGFPRSTIFIGYILALLFLGGLRISKRAHFQLFKNNFLIEGKKTLIVGAGDAGEQILRSMLNSGQAAYLPVGFIDDDPFKQHTSIHGYKVMGKIEDNFRLPLVKMTEANKQKMKDMLIELGLVK